MAQAFEQTPFGETWVGRQGHWLGPTHQEQVHHVVLCHVAILGGILHGLWKKRKGGYQHWPTKEEAHKREPAARVWVRVPRPRCSTGTGPCLPPPSTGTQTGHFTRIKVLIGQICINFPAHSFGDNRLFYEQKHYPSRTSGLWERRGR